MEPITHFLTGACIGRAGLNRKTAYATLAAVLAAEAADIDILWSFAGPVEELKHHRGITHTFLGAPFVAGSGSGRDLAWALLAGAAARAEDRGTHPRLKGRRRGRERAAEPRGQATVHWGWLYLTALIAALSHLLLDWTNNYGVRPFFPFNPRWYAGSFVFIAEPVLWALLLAGPGDALAPRPGGQRDWRAPQAVSRARLGDFCADRDGGAVVLALGQSRRRRG